MKPLDYDLKLISLIKTLRERNGFKHVNLAHPLGVDRTTYGRMENGELAFTPGQLQIMAHELQTNHLQLLILTDSKYDPQFYNTTFSTILIKVIKMAEGRDEPIQFSEAELSFVIAHLKRKYEEMWLAQPSLRYFPE